MYAHPETRINEIFLGNIYNETKDKHNNLIIKTLKEFKTIRFIDRAYDCNKKPLEKYSAVFINKNELYKYYISRLDKKIKVKTKTKRLYRMKHRKTNTEKQTNNKQEILK